MFVKYVVKRGEEAIVVKFDLRHNKLFVGGYFKFINLITTVTKSPYFDSEFSSNTHTQKNKLRFESNIKFIEFSEIIEKLQEDMSCEKVKRVERLM